MIFILWLSPSYDSFSPQDFFSSAMYNRFDGIPLAWDEHAVAACSGGLGNPSTDNKTFLGFPNIDHTKEYEAGKGEFWRLNDAQGKALELSAIPERSYYGGKAPGLMGWWASRSVMFLDNHDTSSSQRIIGHSRKIILWSFASKDGVGSMADIVISHRCGTTKGYGGMYNRFDDIPLAWDEHAVTACSGGLGNPSTGNKTFPGFPNIDHTKEYVRKNILNCLRWLRYDVGFEDFRFDFVRG
ncbi:hypothetical protein V8G54_037883 (chloroplast) [Vigna mungo]|uniref:1,4-alpha-D-glucan glucanohydrolase n=1 Tax=Vigna mungo TaxID=3915 RepID=A0AAQ3MBR4_VIGMU